jgi:hypothetical protein
MSQDPESAQIRSGSEPAPISKLPVLIGAKPKWPLGQTMRSVRLAERLCWMETGMQVSLVSVLSAFLAVPGHDVQKEFQPQMNTYKTSVVGTIAVSLDSHLCVSVCICG